jgi:DNA recombination protein RmuC
MGKRIEDAHAEFMTMKSTRRNQLEKPLRQIEELRRENRLPIETFSAVDSETASEVPEDPAS